jgi:hypothetical protein
MQEPLRKIQTFGDMILGKHAELVDDLGRDYLERMMNSARRMSDQVRGLLNYSRVNTTGKPFTPVDLTGTVREALAGMGQLVIESDAAFEIGDLPTLDADPVQMRLLFQHLIENALKFRSEKKPLIKIYANSVDNAERSGLRTGTQYYDIFVEDNGILTASSLFFGVCTAGARTRERGWDFPFAAGSLRGIMGALQQRARWDRGQHLLSHCPQKNLFGRDKNGREVNPVGQINSAHLLLSLHWFSEIAVLK